MLKPYSEFSQSIQQILGQYEFAPNLQTFNTYIHVFFQNTNEFENAFITTSGLHYLRHFKVKGVDHFSTFELLVMFSILLLRCGDFQSNLGPPYIGLRSSEEHDTSVSSSSGSTFTNTSLNYELIKDKFCY